MIVCQVPHLHLPSLAAAAERAGISGGTVGSGALAVTVRGDGVDAGHAPSGWRAPKLRELRGHNMQATSGMSSARFTKSIRQARHRRPAPPKTRPFHYV